MGAVIAERDVIELDPALERLGIVRTRQVPDAALHFQELLDPLETDRRLRHGVRHLRQVAQRLVRLAEIQQEDDQRPRAQLTGPDKPRAVTEYEASPDR